MFAFNLSFGQTKEIAKGVDLIWGKGFEEERGILPYKLIGADEEHIYLLNKKATHSKSVTDYNMFSIGKKNVFTIQVFDKEGNFVQKKDMQNFPVGKELIFDNLILFNGHLQLFTLDFDKEENSITLYTQEIDKKTLELIDMPTKVISVEDVEAKSFNRALKHRRFYYSPFSITYSPNKETLVIVHDELFSKKERKGCDIVVFDKNIELVYEKNIVFPEPENIRGMGYTIDNDNNFYFQLNLYDGKSDNQYLILKYSNKASELTEYRIKSKFNLFHSLEGISNDGDFISTGFYTNDDDLETNGAFYLKLKPTDEEGEYQIVNQEFPVDLLSEFMSKNKIKKGEGISYMLLIDVVFGKEGNTILVGEHSNTTELWSSSNSETRPLYKDLLAVSISNQGKIEWGTKIPRDQSGYKPADASRIHVGSNVFYVFNEHEFTIKIVKLSEAGSMVDVASISRKEHEVGLITQISKPISENQLLLYVTSGKKAKIGILTFK